MNDWAGIPMPLEGIRLVIEPKYPMGDKLALIGNPAQPEPDVYVRNTFYCGRWRCNVCIYEEPGGKIKHVLLPAFHHLGYDLSTLGASDAWGIEQESRALHLLSTMLRHGQFKQYLLTGMFLEKSERSGLTYMFRKLKPTVAIDAREQSKDCRILCTLCMHPIAYYEGSWAGAMTPTDDVIAHLVLMRGDEHMFWRRCNQHAPDRPEAGL